MRSTNIAGGYCNRIAHIDLTSGKVEMRDLDISLARQFIGDMGISLKLAYDLIIPGIDPLTPANVVIIGVGPLVGTKIQAPRWTAVTKWPLTGTIGVSSGGMGFGVKLKRAGYDHLIITGSAMSPVYLKICDDAIEICDATYLWGRDIIDTTELIWQKYSKDYSVVAIGQAGENLVKLALALVDKISTLGKGGLAAVMGSKNLKAIIVRGTRKEQGIAEPEKFREICGENQIAMKTDPQIQKWAKVGKMTDIREVAHPYNNWNEMYSGEDVEKLYGGDAYLRVKDKRTGCTSCAYPCKDKLEVRQGEYKGLTTGVSSLLGRIDNLGIQNSSGAVFEEFIKLIDIANRYGICTHVFSSVMDLAIELYERGIISDKDTGGLALKRDFTTTQSLLEQVAFKQGLGATLGDGSMGLIKKFGKECEKYSVHIKNLEQHADPRSMDFNMTAFEQIVSPEGAEIEPSHIGYAWQPNHEGFSLDSVRKYCERMDLSKEALRRILGVPFGYNAARLARYAEDFFGVITSLGICEYRTQLYNWEKLASLYSAATGMTMTAGDMKKAGERIWNMFKILNVREGFDRKDDRFPQKWLEHLRSHDGSQIPLVSCTGEAVSIDLLNRMLDDYYDERGWDIRTGIPTRQKLEDLGLG